MNYARFQAVDRSPTMMPSPIKNRFSTVMNSTMDDEVELDTNKIDDTVLALLWLTMRGGDRAWKGHDWDTLARLHKKGMIHDPVGKAKSVSLTPEGLDRCQQLFHELFTRTR